MIPIFISSINSEKRFLFLLKAKSFLQQKQLLRDWQFLNLCQHYTVDFEIHLHVCGFFIQLKIKWCKSRVRCRSVKLWIEQILKWRRVVRNFYYLYILLPRSRYSIKQFPLIVSTALYKLANTFSENNALPNRIVGLEKFFRT